MADQEIQFGVLNVVAHPHDAGTYGRLLARASGREVNFWGDLNGAIRPPREVESGIYQSEIVVGTEIDLDEPLIDRSSLEEVPAGEDDARAARSHLYNGRVFLLTFVEATHLLVFESKNEFGKQLSPQRAQRLFSRLLSQELLGPDSPYVDVTVVPEDDTLARLLGIHRLDFVEMYLKKPNPDTHDDDAQAILDELEEQGAKSQDLKLTRAPGADRLELNARNLAIAAVAQFNGFVRAKGYDEDGEHVDGSTRSYPKIIKVVRDAATSIPVVARRIARELKIGQETPPDGN